MHVKIRKYEFMTKTCCAVHSGLSASNIHGLHKMKSHKEQVKFKTFETFFLAKRKWSADKWLILTSSWQWSQWLCCSGFTSAHAFQGNTWRKSITCYQSWERVCRSSTQRFSNRSTLSRVRRMTRVTRVNFECSVRNFLPICKIMLSKGVSRSASEWFLMRGYRDHGYEKDRRG